LSFANLHAWQLYSDDMLGVAEHIISRGLIYHQDLWEIPCRIAREISPFATVHVRGGDGPFKRNKTLSRSFEEEFTSVKEELDRSGSVLCRFASESDCPQGQTNRTARLFVMSDLTWETMMEKFGRPLTKFSNERSKWAAKHGWKWSLLATNQASAYQAANDLRFLPRMQVAGEPKHIPGILLDAMLATLSDIGFVGHPKSTLSMHVIEMRRRWSRSQLCAVHDHMSAVAETWCPSTKPHPYDVLS
jgi:hypothetical protein